MHYRQVYDEMTAEQDHDDLRNEVLHVEELKQTVWWRPAGKTELFHWRSDARGDRVWSQSSALLEANEEHELMLKCGHVASNRRQEELQHA